MQHYFIEKHNYYFHHNISFYENVNPQKFFIPLDQELQVGVFTNKVDNFGYLIYRAREQIATKEGDEVPNYIVLHFSSTFRISVQLLFAR